MDPNNTNSYQPTPEDQSIQRQYVIQLWKERIYRFFYNIWPGVNRVLTGFFYLILKIFKSFMRIALESFHQ